MSETYNQAFIETHKHQLNDIAQTIERVLPKGRFTTVIVQDGYTAEPLFWAGEHSPASYTYANPAADQEQLQGVADINNKILLACARGKLAVAQAFASRTVEDQPPTKSLDYSRGIWRESIFLSGKKQNFLLEMTALEGLEIFGKCIRYELSVNDSAVKQTLAIQRLGEAVVGITKTSKSANDMLYGTCLHLLDSGVSEIALMLHGYFKTESELKHLIGKVRDMHRDSSKEESISMLLDVVYESAMATKFEQSLDETHSLSLPTSEELNAASFILEGVKRS
jgi:hypothetical protein